MAIKFEQEIKGSKEDIVKLHMDTMGFSEKPDKKFKENKIWKILTRAGRNIVSVSKEELVDHILNGFSTIPGVCPMDEERIKEKYKSAIQKDWKQQQIFALDFDSDIEKGQPESHMDEVLEKLREYGIYPFFIYGSFSDGKYVLGKQVEKFRVFFATNEVVVDRELRDKLQATLMGLFWDYIDKRCYNRNRYFNGTTQQARVYLDYSAVIDPNWIVDTYWDDNYEKFIPGDVRKRIKKNKKLKNLTVVEKVEKKSMTHDLIPVDEFEDEELESDNVYLKRNMRKHCEELLELVKTVEGKEGTGRRDVIYFVFYTAAFAYSTRKAYEICIDINNNFEEPLSDKEFMDNIRSALKHTVDHEYRYDTMLEKMNIDKSLLKNLDYFKNLEAKEHADKFRQLKKERNEFISELYKGGKSSREIARELKRRYGENSELAISDRSVRKYIEKNLSQVGTFGTSISFNNIFICPSTEIEVDLEENSEQCLEVERSQVLEFNKFGKELKINQLNERQQKALKDALNGSNILITGGAGVGKSYVVEKIIEELEKQGKKIGICAPSALAASSYEDGMTFHRMFGYSESETIYLDVIDRLFYLDVIIIEEVGMLGKKQMDFMGRVLDYIEDNYRKKTQIILIGDFLQLPPIEDQYCFESAYYNHLNPIPHYLIENIRQKGSEALFNALNDIRLYKDASKEINRICSKYEDFNSIYLVPKRDMAKDKNNECLKRLEGELIDLGNDQFIKIGAKIICTKNAYVNGKLKYYNGLQGKVIKVSKGKNIVTIKDTKENIIRISRCDVEQDNGAIAKKFPFELGYAITIHKSQGMTLDSANIELKVFASGQLYVALSRVKTAEGIHLLHPVRSKDIICNDESKKALEFDEDLRRQCDIIHDAA